MKTKQPDHCAHVAAYYADKSDTMAWKPSRALFGVPAIYLEFSNRHMAEDPPSPHMAVAYLRSALAYIRLATKFWLRAGGAGGEVAA